MFRLSVGLLGILALLALAGCGGGSGNDQALTTGQINGHVYLSADQQVTTDSTRGRELASGAEVRVIGTPWSTVTGTDGTFAFSGLPAGQYRVAISHSGHQSVELPVTVVPGQTAHLENAAMAPTTRKWTVLVYLNADNDLEPFGIDDVNEMESVPNSDEVTVLVQMDRSPGYDTSNGNWTATKRLRIQHDDDPTTITSPVLDDLGEVDMGNSATAREFIAWGQQLYPAEHYLFIFWNHGSGWKTRQAIAAIPTRSISYDDTSRTVLRTIDLPAALTAQTPLDLVSFDACLMQMLEIGYEMRNSCRYVVASEDDVPGEGYAYQTWLGSLGRDPAMSPVALGTTMARESRDYYASTPYITHSVVDVGRLDAVTTAVDVFAQALLRVGTRYTTELQAVHNETDAYADAEYKDLYHYAELAKAKVKDTAVKTAADQVMAAVSQAVVAEFHTSGHPNAHGLSIYCPSLRGYATYASRYTPLAFAQRTAWDDWLRQHPE